MSCDEPVKNGCEIYEIFHVSLHILFKLKGFPNFAPFNSYPRKNDDYLLTWNAFRISDPSTLIPQKTMITPRHLRHTRVRMRNENEKMLIRIATYQSLLLQQIKCTRLLEMAGWIGTESITEDWPQRDRNFGKFVLLSMKYRFACYNFYRDFACPIKAIKCFILCVFFNCTGPWI